MKMYLRIKGYKGMNPNVTYASASLPMVLWLLFLNRKLRLY